MATSLVCAAAIDAARHAAMAALAAAPTQRPAPHMHTSITQQAHACSTAHYTHPAHGTSCFALPSRPANLHLRRIAMLASHPPHCAATAHRRAALLDLPATVAAPGPPDRSLGCGGARPTRHTTCMALHDAWRLHRPSPSYFLYFAISAVPFGAPIILAPFGTGEPMLSFSTELLAGATARGFSLPPAIPGSKPCVACVHLCDLAATAILLVAMMLCLRMRAPSRLCSAARQSAGRSFADDDCRRRGAHAGAAAAAVRDWLA